MRLYKIIGNNDYLLTEDLKILIFKKDAPELKETNDRVKISLYGLKERWVEKSWLKLISVFNLDMPEGYEHNIFKLDFIEIQNNIDTSVEQHIVIAKTPIYHKVYDTFRLIPRFPNYFINFNGKVLNFKTNKFLNPTNINNSYYPTVAIKDQAGIYVTRMQLVHRLVAFTWIPNNDYNKYTIIDHIDGNKKNYHISNLRWVDSKQNNNSVFEQGCRSDNYPVLVRNIETGEVTKHWTLTKACEFIGRSRINTVLQPLDIDMIWKGKNGKFEIKKEDDPREWFYIGTTKNLRLHVNTFDIYITINGKKNYYKSWRDVSLKLLNENEKSLVGKEKTIDKLKNKYPDIKIDYKIRKGVIGTNGVEIYKTDSISKMSKLINIPKSTITKYIALKKAYGKWKFKVDDGTNKFDDVHDYMPPKNKPKQISLYIKDTKVTKIFNSLRELSRYLNMDKNLIKYIVTNKNGMSAKYIIKYLT